MGCIKRERYKVKSHGDMEGVYINGTPQGITFHETDEFTLYPASILTVSKNRPLTMPRIINSIMKEVLKKIINTIIKKKGES